MGVMFLLDITDDQIFETTIGCQTLVEQFNLSNESLIIRVIFHIQLGDKSSQ